MASTPHLVPLSSSLLGCCSFLLRPLSYFDQGPYCSFQHGSTLHSFLTPSRPRAAPCLFRLCPPALLLTPATCCSGRAPTFNSFCQLREACHTFSATSLDLFLSSILCGQKIPMSFLQMLSASRGRVFGPGGPLRITSPTFHCSL